MIFVSVGTHTQHFDRLLERVDALAATLDERVFVQTGVSTRTWTHCDAVDFLVPAQVEVAMVQARVIVLHGGSSSFLLARGLGRTPIVVPRDPGHDEHVDDHQLRFARHLAQMGEAVVTSPGGLADVVAGWSESPGPAGDRTAAFVAGLDALVTDLIRT